MTIHIGKKIKERLYQQNLSVSDFAKKINRSRNVVYDIFGRKSIDTDLLNLIGKALNCDFFSIYSSQKEFSSDSIKRFSESETVIANGKHSEQIKQHHHLTLQNEISYLKKIIELLEQKREAKINKKPLF